MRPSPPVYRHRKIFLFANRIAAPLKNVTVEQREDVRQLAAKAGTKLYDCRTHSDVRNTAQDIIGDLIIDLRRLERMRGEGDEGVPSEPQVTSIVQNIFGINLTQNDPFG